MHVCVGIYSCPAYYYPRRTGSRERPSFIVAVDLRSGDKTPEHWTKRGTAILLSLDVWLTDHWVSDESVGGLQLAQQTLPSRKLHRYSAFLFSAEFNSLDIHNEKHIAWQIDLNSHVTLICCQRIE